jgi:hypothetical protein
MIAGCRKKSSPDWNGACLNSKPVKSHESAWKNAAVTGNVYFFRVLVQRQEASSDDTG